MVNIDSNDSNVSLKSTGEENVILSSAALNDQYESNFINETGIYGSVTPRNVNPFRRNSNRDYIEDGSTLNKTSLASFPNDDIATTYNPNNPFRATETSHDISSNSSYGYSNGAQNSQFDTSNRNDSDLSYSSYSYDDMTAMFHIDGSDPNRLLIICSLQIC